MKRDLKKIPSVASRDERDGRERLVRLYHACPIPDQEVLANLGLYQNGPALARILFMNELYQKIVPLHGVIMEFGCRWGQNLALFLNLRGIHEPFNFNRKIIGFDTFGGFLSVDKKDGPLAKTNGFKVTPGYEQYLEQILALHDKHNPVGHMKKFELIKGDAAAGLEQYFRDNPETVIALAYFDLDLYEPTKGCLELIQDHLAKGSILGFDELNYHDFPGETLALKEVMGLRNHRLTRCLYSRTNCFVELG
ncbi:MAG: crotonobetainyl-CoA--carnitine CoA-transferase [Syntrophorhabdales bacterium]|jgi:hypothetical protein